MVLTARVVYCFAGAWLLYCGFEARLVFFLRLRSTLRLRFVLSPLGLHSVCPFAHCPSVARFLALLVVPLPPEFGASRVCYSCMWLRSLLGVLLMPSKRAPLALCFFVVRFPFSACPFAHCLSAARSLALLIVLPPPAFGNFLS